MLRTLVLAALFAALIGPVAAADVTRLSVKNCSPGLRSQPSGGPFSVFVFCDDALGVNVAVINASGGAGPGSIKLDGPKLWDRWQVDDRVWQEPSWAKDVTSFAWSKNLRFLYIATSGTYGTGFTYKLDLVARKATAIFPTPSEKLDPTYSIDTSIVRLDRQTGEFIVSLSRYDPASARESTTQHRVK